MSRINLPVNIPATNWNTNWSTNNPNVAMANFEEEKSFFAAMYVVVAPNARRRIRHKRSRRERERAMSCLGRVIRRLQPSGLNLNRERKSEDNPT